MLLKMNDNKIMQYEINKCQAVTIEQILPVLYDRNHHY